MAKLDIDRIVSEYFMLKTVLNNKYSMDVLSGRVQPAGPSAAADKKTLQAMQRYVKTFGETVIPGNGLSSNETIDSYVNRLMNNFKAAELAKPASRRLVYSDNPFEETFRPYVSTVLSQGNAKAKIENAIRSNPSTLDSVNSLVVNLGGKKQSSYVRLLSQSTDLFSTVSGLRNQIDRLKIQRKADKAEIDRLQKELEAKTKEAENYRQLCEKAIEELGDNVSYTIMVGLLRQTSDGLEGIVRSEAQRTREHVTEQTDRVVDLLTAKDRIKSHMFSKGKNEYPRYFMVLQNTKKLNNKGMSNLYKEIVHAAKAVGISEQHPAVESFYNELREQRLKNDNEKTNTVVIREKKHGAGVKVLTAALVLAVVGGGFLGYKYIEANNQNTNLTQQNEALANENDHLKDSTFAGQYAQYQDRENQQYDEYVSKVDIAIKDGTLVSLPGVTPTPGATNGEVWNVDSLNALLDKYAEDDFMKVDNSGKLEGVTWSQTPEMQLYTTNAMNQIRADFYQTHYDVLVSEVANLTGQVNDLTSQLNSANALNATLQSQVSSLQGQNQQLTAENQQLKAQINALNGIISNLEAQVDSLESQIDSLNAIIEAANQENGELAAQVAELTNQLNQAKAEIADLQAQVDSLSAENAQLRQEVANLKAQVNGLENEVDSLNSQITVLEQENKVLSTEKADLLSQVDALQDEIDSLKKQIAEMGDVEGLYQEKAALEAKVAELEGQLEDANDRIAGLEAENEALTNTITELRNENKELKDKVANLEKTIKDQNATIADLENSVSDLQQQLSESRTAYNNLLQEYNNYKQSVKDGLLENEEIARLEQELNDAYAQITSYEQSIVQLYNGITKDSANSSQAKESLEKLFKMFGINYSESDSPSNDNSEYQPGR